MSVGFAERGTEQDADCEREEHRDERDDMEPEIDHVRCRSLRRRGALAPAADARLTARRADASQRSWNQRRKLSTTKRCSESETMIIIAIARIADATSSTMSRRRVRPSVQAADALRVDERGSEPQPREERRRHPRRPLSRNSTIVACVPTATMSVAPASYASSMRRVFAHALGDELVVRTPAVEQMLAPGRARRGARDARARAPQCIARVGQRVEVADDDVGHPAELEQHVGTAVDRDEHGLELADVRPQRTEVVLVVVPAHDDQRVATADLRAQRRQLERLEGDARLRCRCTRACCARTAELVTDRRGAPLPCAARSRLRPSSSPTASFSPSRQSAPSRTSTSSPSWTASMTPGADSVEQRDTARRRSACGPPFG